MSEQDMDKRPETGWGEMFQQYFDPAKAKIDNRVMNGRSKKFHRRILFLFSPATMTNRSTRASDTHA